MPLEGHQLTVAPLTSRPGKGIWRKVGFPFCLLRNSPVLLEPRGGGTLLLPVGAMEGNEFIRQSEDMAAAWSARGADARAWVMPGHHHFSIINQYIDPESELSVAARRQMGL